MEEATKLIDNIFIGNIQDGNNDLFLSSNNISHIFRFLSDDDIDYMNKRLISKFPKENIYLYKINDDFDADITSIALNAYKNYVKIKNNTSNILFHCMAGYSRSVCVVAFILVKEGYFLTFLDALDYIHKLRPKIYPNVEFILQLRSLLDT